MSPNEANTHPANVVARFRLRGVWVDQLLLGAVATWHHQEHRVTLRFPSQTGDLAPLENDDTPPVPAIAGTATMDGTGSPVSVQLIEVEVHVDSMVNFEIKELALEASAAGDEAPLKEFRSLAEAEWRRGFAVAAEAAHAWLQHVRVISGQAWLGTAVEPPLQHGRSAIIDAQNQRTLMQFGPMQSLTIRHGSLALDEAKFELVQLHVGAATRPFVADQLLADARFLSSEAPTRDQQRAILSAAAACEIKTKQTIRIATPAIRKELSEMVLRKTSNLPDLLDRVAFACLDRSLKSDNPELFRQIQQLTKTRNSVIHEGSSVSEMDGHRLTAASSQLFLWLESLEITRPSGVERDG